VPRHRPDPLHLSLVFNIEHSTALLYAIVAEHLLSDELEHDSAEVMSELPALNGTTAIAGQQTTVDGADFWRVGSVASGFSGDAGRRRLGLLIQTLLPKPSDTLEL